VIRAEGGSQTIGPGAVAVRDLNRLPYPDYDDYFEQIRPSPIRAQAEIVLPFESSRGCWYGARQHCTFCGLNGETMAFRSKSPERVLDEVRELTRRYGLRRLAATDNILDLHYLHSLIPELAGSDLRLSVHYEVKANLSYEQMRLLKQAGVDRLQPGIESLSTSILKLMQKGCTALQNIQFLKWASGLGIDAAWNFLLGFPGEDPHEYVRMAALIPALVHLQPPQGFGFIRLDRFSPYFNDPGRFGLTNLRPAAGYTMSYPFPAAVLGRLAYYFEYDYADGRVPAQYAAPTVDMLRYWSRFNCPFGFTFKIDRETLLLRDRRPQAAQEHGALSGAERAAYEYLEAAHPFKALQAHLSAGGHRVDDSTLRGWLEAWVQKRWIVCDRDWFLSLAVPMSELL
jgi:ribosomal peptide maturation radical SAM protein 1